MKGMYNGWLVNKVVWFEMAGFAARISWDVT